MTKRVHIVYISFFIIVFISTLVVIVSFGYDYYSTPLTERFFQEDYNLLKPSGSIGHGFGIIGTTLIVIGVASYVIRKRVKRFARLGLLKHWLEFHIFLCTLGPLLVLFHTAFKFGGIVSISFWSMIAVVLSGIIGRYIYLQIPRSIDGVELSFEESRELNFDLSHQLRQKYNLDGSIIDKLDNYSDNESRAINILSLLPIMIKGFWVDRDALSEITKSLKKSSVPRKNINEVKKMCKAKLKLNRRLSLLKTTQKLFSYWHIVHFPFAILMLVIMVVHVAITIVFGYRWIF
ncbi:hypothetical protein MNBD_IGNAVI01-981 [hydrothermal vent metagenome]|uniref:Uncharacterized protein n=1 Tax=hydrothermal vent metagenome TaxID=652676 RepID=A0A3B1D0B4_9ZZZZ